jgi:tetratricopeptide (TPR) repeat protein
VLAAQSSEDVNRPASVEKVAEAPTTDERSQNLKAPLKPTGQLAEQLWRSRTTAPEPAQNAEHKEGLQRLIFQIRSVRLKKGLRSPEPKAKPRFQEAEGESAPGHETTEEPSQTQQEESKTGFALPDETIPPETFQLLDNLSQDTTRLQRPAEVAEILFLSGRSEKAAAFYQQALQQIDPNDTSTAHDRAWILFQIGNCLRDADPAAAGNMYRKLLSEFPDSPWTHLARVWEQFAQWYEKDDPYALLSESESSF